MSSHDPRVVPEIGLRTELDSVEIKWPDPADSYSDSQTTHRSLHHDSRGTIQVGVSAEQDSDQGRVGLTGWSPVQITEHTPTPIATTAGHFTQGEFRIAPLPAT
jgi:hypothetical protein